MSDRSLLVLIDYQRFTNAVMTSYDSCRPAYVCDPRCVNTASVGGEYCGDGA